MIKMSIRKVVEMIARQLGITTRTLNNSSQATGNFFIAFKPDILILDMILPEKDRIDVLNEVLLTGIPVKVVLTSGFSDSYCAWLRVWQNSTIIPSFRAAQAVPPRRAD